MLAAAAAGMLAVALSCTAYNQQRTDSEVAEARATPEFGSCVNGKRLSAVSNCGEVCQAAGKACQNNGCEHPQDKSSRFGGLGFGGSLCLEKPDRAFNCYDAFTGEVGVRCCCVKP